MTDTTPISPIADALADRYRIERELGAGGMATVYLADDLKHDRKVALKVLKPELAAVLGGDRFVQEIKTTANLQHPHILPLFDSGVAGGFLYYVMPFIDGETLRDKLNRETQLGVDEALRITTEVADALDYAHRQGVIHRDIKPENILLHDGRPMVADFGIALALSAAAGGRMTETGMSLGTPHYMSPEQATAEKELSPRSDVYSLGSVLYEMLAGEPPHTGATAQAIILKIVADTARPVTDLRKSVPPNVAAALAKSLEKLPADRFDTAKAFSEALANPSFTVAGTAVGPGASGADAQSVTTGVSKRLFAGVAAIAVLLLATTLMFALRSGPTPRVSRYSVTLPLIPLQEFAATGGRIITTPDGKRLVFLGDEGKLFVRPLDALEARPLEGTENAYAPFISPDGTQVGFLVPGRTEIRTTSLAGGPSLTVADSGIGAWGGTWSADGYIYASSAAPTETGIIRVPAIGGKPPEPVTVIDREAGETGHLYPQALPNGKHILFTVQRGGLASTNDIAITEPGSRKHRILVRGVSARYSPSGHLLYVTNDGTLMAVPFDQDRGALSGTAVPIVEGLPTRGAFGEADLTISSNGTLWYETGTLEFKVEPMWVTRDGVATAVQPGWVGDFRYPALSPDGTRMAFSIAEGGAIHLWIKRLDQGTQTIFTREGGVNFRPSWSPDGRTIAFVTDRGPNYDVLTKPADQSAQPRLLMGRDSEMPIWEVVYAPSGPWVLLRSEGRGSDLYAVRPGVDSAPTPLVVTDANERLPALSPDGRWLAYVSNVSGRSEVYVRPFPNVDETTWQVSTTGGYEPRWAHSGRELFFRNEAEEFMAVPIAAGATFEWGEPETLFSIAGFRTAGNGRMYDVAPGDQRFLMLRTVPSDDPSELIVVENFFEELKAKVPR